MRLITWITSCAVLLLTVAVSLVCAETPVNSLKEVTVQTEDNRSVVHIKTDQSVGYRYTVYDSNDPVRVVIDFPRMGLGGLQSPIKVDTSPIQEIRLSTFDLSLGSLARVEILLEKESEYRVNFNENDMQISFTSTGSIQKIATQEPVTQEPVTQEPVTQEPVTQEPVTQEPVTQEPVTQEPVTQEPVTQEPVTQSGITVTIDNAKVLLHASGGIGKVRYFTLDKPKRLVIDLYGVITSTKKNYTLHSGFNRMRTGPYPEKTRFVLDVNGEIFPQFTVSEKENDVSISWVDAKKAVAKIERKPVTSTVRVKDIDFFKEKASSKLVIELDGPVKVESLAKDAQKVQFSLLGATIPRSLRRVYDTLAFPSAIHSVTPYLVSAGEGTDVRFSVQLKGEVETSLDTNDNTVVLTVADGDFAGKEPLDGEAKLVSVSEQNLEMAKTGSSITPVEKPSEPLKSVPSVNPSEDIEDGTDSGMPSSIIGQQKATEEYTGEKITLVFDNANVKNILQLIAEVSNQNIIASDEVKGSVTLRLVDVPWDQALSLVLDITGLGMIQEGNVVRVLPKESIRAMKNAELTAVTTAEKLEPLETEIVPVNYADLGSVSGPARDLLSDRGKITEDQRNKALVITDVPQRIGKIRELVQLLDTPERQVMIEARIVEVNSNFSRDLGVNWGLSRENDRAGGGSDSTLDVGAGGSFLIGTPAAGSVATTSGLGVGMTFGNLLVDNTILSMRISALESAGNAKVISTPRVTTLNGEQALISQGTTIPYQSSGDDGLPKTEFVNAELKLEVTPVINPDGSVILEIVATNDSPSLTGGTSDAPQIDTKKAETKVMVKDGQTTVIGGIFIENDSESESGVPLLKEIPILGNLFKSKAKANSKAELMIFITPRILQ